MFEPVVKFVVFDFDGTFTNCQFYVTSDGTQIKAYNGKDSYGIKILYDLGVKTALLTSHDSDCFNHILKANHFNKLDFFDKGSRNKIEVLNEWRIKLKLHWSQIAYIGDDLNDIECLKSVGIAGCPADAVPEVQDVCIFWRR